jgi:hypothetical protein
LVLTGFEYKLPIRHVLPVKKYEPLYRMAGHASMNKMTTMVNKARSGMRAADPVAIEKLRLSRARLRADPRGEEPRRLFAPSGPSSDLAMSDAAVGKATAG